ncbi:MAG: hypothetical protein ACXADC_17000 [Candidatus Thorarchaeota archaeon]|jgi:hypothetical protein
MKLQRLYAPLGCILLLVGLVFYIWPRVYGAGAPYGENDIPAIIGLVTLLFGLCLCGGSRDSS